MESYINKRMQRFWRKLWSVVVLFSFILLTQQFAAAQAIPLQVIRGKIVEQFIKSSISFATIKVKGVDSLVTYADSTGEFSTPLVKTGRYSLEVSCVGYKTKRINNLLLEAGKQLVLSIEMEESVAGEKELVLFVGRNKALPLNKMAAVSARVFGVEETRRYAAGINDPSRMAVAFPGVAANGDGNALIIRGNAPNGLLWRMEGIDIPNPNHFSQVGTSGGGISILSAQLLANSDFITGAFPAEYGNALSGVFDIHLRRGNAQMREHTVSVSTIGIDVATEGPIKKGSPASYLINYRYGFLTLMQQLGLNVGDSPTSFQDLSFVIAYPTRRTGKFTLFGFGGKSQQQNPAFADSLRWTQLPSNRSGNLDLSNTGATGLTYEQTIFKKVLFNQVISLSGFKYREDDFYYPQINATVIYTRKNSFVQRDINYRSSVTYKISQKHVISLGLFGSFKKFNLLQREIVSSQLRDKVAVTGRTHVANYFIQWMWSPFRQLSIISGLHQQQLSLNRSTVLEPRLGLRWQIATGQFITAGLGQHAQLQPLGNYFARIRVGNDTVQPNLSLGFSKAKHYVIGYAIQFAPNWNLKLEWYYQWLYAIPVTAGTKTNFSALNVESDYVITPLINQGKGKNVGVEITLERWWNDQFYFLSTLSLYQSTYVGSDGVWRNTRFNSNHSWTMVSGKEWKLNGKRPKTFSADVKILRTGGQRVTPINFLASYTQRRTVFYTDRLYEEKLAPFFRVDLQCEWRIQYKKHTLSIISGVQNLTNRRNYYNYYYDPNTRTIAFNNLQRIIPVVGCKFDF